MRRIVTLLLLVPLIEAGPPALAQTITLMPEATIDAEQVTVGGIARVSSPVPGEAEQVARLLVQTAPVVGGRDSLALAALRERLMALGVNRAVWALQGASVCRITRVAGPAEQIAQLQARSRTMRAGLTGTMAAVPEAIIPDSLAGCIGKLLVDHYQPAGGRLTLRFAPSDRSLLALQRPQFRFELAIQRVGRQSVDVSARIFAVRPEAPSPPASIAPTDARPACAAEARFGGRRPGPTEHLPARPKPASAGEGLVKSADIRVVVRLAAPVVVARRTINRGQVVAGDDVELSVRSIELTSSAPRKTVAVIGQQARRMIRTGEVVEAADLTPLALVRRNRLVTVWVRRGGMLIKTVGRAMQDGVYGEKVLVRNEVSRQPFYGVVSGPDTVELDPTPVRETRRRAPPKPPAAPTAGRPDRTADRTRGESRG